MYRNHRKMIPLIRATTAPTITTIRVVELVEEPDDVLVWEGRGVAGVAVESRAGLVVRPKLGVVVVRAVVGVDVGMAAATRLGTGVAKKAL